MTGAGDDPLWRPSAPADSQLQKLMNALHHEYGAPADDYFAFHAWTLKEPEKFWLAVWDHTGMRGESGDIVVDDVTKLPGADWFPDAEMNYAEELLRPRMPGQDALVFRNEAGAARRLTYIELYEQVSRCVQVFEDLGLQPGDRVAAYVPNVPETVIAMLAAASLGVIFSSASPDFGVRGALDRFGQIQPKVLIACDGYVYGGKTHESLSKVKEIAAGLPSLKQTLIVPYVGGGEGPIAGIKTAELWPKAMAAKTPQDIKFFPLGFSHPLFILYSSGTTGAPKCIVHSHGGTLLKHVSEQRYHSDIRDGDRVFFFTTCGWMMWNWLASALACNATVLLYDGSPFHPGPEVLWTYAAEEKATLFGTSAKYIDALKTHGFSAEAFDLANLRTIGSTGSPLAPESFDYVYEQLKSDVHLASIAGGTDLIGCFILGVPTLPVYRGEIQGPGLGMAVEVCDETGRPKETGTGELVCTKAFPSVPLGFWGDEHDQKFMSAYFSQNPGKWTHGDWIERTSRGGYVIHGRSDATLNPGGVRIGTAEIYRAVEAMDEVSEALAVGQRWQGDVRVILFVTLTSDQNFSEELSAAIKHRVRTECSPRHTPAHVIAVSDLPRTKSGKLSELAVRSVIHGEPVKNTEALANPETLKQFEDLEDLRS